MKSLLLLLERILEDSSIQCRVSTSRDLLTILSRSKNEGLSFLTITLPNFGRDFENCLDQGQVREHHFLGFRRNGGLPAFLRGFLSLIFDRTSGTILHTPSIAAISSVRQICLMFKKLRSPCSTKRTKLALEQYVLTDLEVASFEDSIEDYALEAFSDAFGFLFNPVLARLEKDLRNDINIVIPKHGPGTTADGTQANDKFKWSTWTERLSTLLRREDFLVPNESFNTCGGKPITLRPRDEPPVRVITVPKTLKTPRIIAVEPVHMQYVQQGILELLVPLLESPLMKGALGFTDQTVNQAYARLGSKYQWFATLDLSEASDRVSNLLVQRGFKWWPTLSALIQACRSTTADVPGHGIIPISKFASMGSALCFPIEAMTFVTVLFLSRYGAKDGIWTNEDRSDFLSSVRVYGDDIIVPVGYARDAARELSRFNLKVNQHKSFWTGEFRESCGGDFYRGISVKPVYVKDSLPRSLAEVDAFESTVSSRNQLYFSGYWNTARFIDSHIERFAPFPIVSSTSPGLGRQSFLSPRGQKDCKRLHRPLVKALTRRSKARSSNLDGAGALMKFFLKRGSEPFFSKDHLNFSGRPKSAVLQLRWVPL